MGDWRVMKEAMLVMVTVPFQWITITLTTNGFWYVYYVNPSKCMGEVLALICQSVVVHPHTFCFNYDQASHSKVVFILHNSMSGKICSQLPPVECVLQMPAYKASLSTLFLFWPIHNPRNNLLFFGQINQMNFHLRRHFWNSSLSLKESIRFHHIIMTVFVCDLMKVFKTN